MSITWQSTRSQRIGWFWHSFVSRPSQECAQVEHEQTLPKTTIFGGLRNVTLIIVAENYLKFLN
jgi:hypothetical protein